MKYYKITLELTDAVKAKDYDTAKNKVIWDILPNIEWNDFMTIEECNKKDYKENTRQ